MKESNNNTGAGVPLYQIQSSLPVLVPQFTDKLTSARIWYAQVILDHFSYLTYVQVMKSTREE